MGDRQGVVRHVQMGEAVRGTAEGRRPVVQRQVARLMAAAPRDDERREPVGQFEMLQVVCSQVETVTVTAEETRWTRMLVDGVPHDHGFVLDAKTKTKRPQRDLPSSSEPLRNIHVL
jgi:hypothetical protein